MYLQVIHGLIEKSLTCFASKQNKKSKKLLKIVIRVAEIANDFQLLMKIYNLIGVLLLNNRKFVKAIKYFKTLRDIAEEIEQDKIKLQAYSLLGSCYQFMKEYENAIKCFKK